MPPTKENLERVDKLNYAAVADTLVHHGECLGGLNEAMQTLQTQVVSLKQELDQQRGLIVRSLQSKYGHGSTSGE